MRDGWHVGVYDLEVCCGFVIYENDLHGLGDLGWEFDAYLLGLIMVFGWQLVVWLTNEMQGVWLTKETECNFVIGW